MRPSLAGGRVRRGDEEGNGGSLAGVTLISEESERANGLDFGWNVAWVGDPPPLVFILRRALADEGMRWCSCDEDEATRP